ncbi:MAG: hypothetical protein ACLQVD_21920 [Capsulimonadaceae bacterium]
MHHIQLSDQVYDRAKLRADEAGFDSVDDYIVTLLAEDDACAEIPHLPFRFTPERIADPDCISTELKAEEPMYAVEEVTAHLSQHHAAWC